MKCSQQQRAPSSLCAQLEDTHKLLHEEHRKRFKLEDDLTHTRMELSRIPDLESQVALLR